MHLEAKRLLRASLVLCLALAGPAWAQEEPPKEETTEGQPPPEGTPEATPEATPSMGVMITYAKADWPQEFVLRTTVWPKGMIAIRIPIDINLSKGAVGKPVFLPLELFYGVTEDLSVGLIHARGLCFTGKDNGCAKFYDDVGLTALYRVLRGNFDMAAQLSLLIGSFDPFLLSVGVGVKGRVLVANNKLAILFNPIIGIGITERDAGNKEFLSIPVDFMYQVTPMLAAGIGTTFGGPLDGFGDFFTGSLDIQGLYAVNKMIDVFLEFSFTNLYGKNGGADGRLLIIGANLHL